MRTYRQRGNEAAKHEAGRMDQRGETKTLVARIVDQVDTHRILPTVEGSS